MHVAIEWIHPKQKTELHCQPQHAERVRQALSYCFGIGARPKFPTRGEAVFAVPGLTMEEGHELLKLVVDERVPLVLLDRDTIPARIAAALR